MAIVLSAATALFGAAAVQGGGTVHADTDPPAGTPATVSTDPLPTWQINGVVWSMATVGTTVYATGRFTKARPPGTAAGDPAEVVRNNILAFDITTGNLIPSFNHTLNGQGMRIVASPDGSKVYVGGEFTEIDGQPRNRLAAFNTATGALDPAFKPSVSAVVRGIAATNSTVYFGGNFFNVNGNARTRLAAVKASDGTNINTWKPTADDDEVFALAVAPSQTRVIIGGRFQKLNGATKVGVGAVDATTGASAIWTSTPIPARLGTNQFSYTTDFSSDGTNIYASADGEGGHWFDGRYAANAENGDLVWLDNCYGATYGMFVQDKTVYSVSHAHDCSSLGAFPEMGLWRRALAETTYPTGTDKAPPGSNSSYSGQPIPTLLHWFPQLAPGTFTGQNQAAWSVTGNSQYVALGGEFPTVNSKPQQGLTRFAVKNTAPNKIGPDKTLLGTPTATSLPGGRIRVSWKTTWDTDNHKLKYEVLRDGDPTPIGTVEAGSNFWTMPNAGFMDATASPGIPHTYTVRAKDPFGNPALSAVSNAATPGSGTSSGYTDEIAADNATSYWRLGEGSGSVGYDYSGFNDLTLASGYTRGQTGAISGDTDKATKFSGSTSGTSASGKTATPGSFSVEAWFKTSTGLGGKIVGYGDKATGNSSSYDRHIYMANNGRLIFGAYPGEVRTVQSGTGYNNNKWHHVVGTIDADAGMKLYVDGQQVAADANTKGGQDYAGYWRVGGDSVSSWPSSPLSSRFSGTIDDVAVYSKALTGSQVTRHFGVGSGTIAPNKPPTAAFTQTCEDLTCTLDAAGSTDPDGTIESYAWDFGDDKSGTGANPAHTYTAPGTYTIKLTVTDNNGAADSTSKTVTVTSPVLAADAFERNVSGGFGTADTGGAWTIAGAAANYAVNGGVGKITMPAPAAGPATTLTSVSSTGTELTFDFSSDKEGTGNGVYLWATARQINGAGAYRAKARLRPSGVVSIQLTRTDAANVETALGTETVVAGLTYAPGTKLRLKFQAVGTTPTSLKMKVWAAGSAEPGWQLTTTDDTAALQAAGFVGVRTYLAGNATNAPVVVSVDDVKAVKVTP